MSSVKLLVRTGPFSHGTVEVTVELIADLARDVQIEAQSGGDDVVRSHAPVEANCHPVTDKVQQHRLPSGEGANGVRDVRDRHVVGVGHLFERGYGRSFGFLGHSYSTARGALSGGEGGTRMSKVAA